MFRYRTALACALVAAAVTPAGALTVTSIKITNDIPTWLQVAEVVATQYGTGTDVALGGTATASSIYDPSAGPENAIDGNTGGGYGTDHIFHSGTPNGGEYLLIDLNGAYDLSSLAIYGRTDCCTDRDIFDYTLFNGSDVVGSGRLDASTTNPVFVAFESDVPEPASWAMMVGGFGLLGGALRRKKASVSFA